MANEQSSFVKLIQERRKREKERPKGLDKETDIKITLSASDAIRLNNNK